MAVTEDQILSGRVRLRQASEGYRAGLDAAMLAAACDAGAGARVFEAGCGVGAALLAAAWRQRDALFTGVERDAATLDAARENVALNGLEARVTVLGGDVTAPFRSLGLAPFDAVMANPPYFDDAGALRGPAEAKQGAWIADGGLGAWTGFLLNAARDGGSVTLIHRADRLGDILTLLAAKAGSFQIRPLHPFADAPAKRVVVRAIKRGKTPLRLLAPLILHERGGAKHTARAEAILRGDARLEWM
jgi:tRNA1(Val) A37 N6-methylase TrmN6